MLTIRSNIVQSRVPRKLMFVNIWAWFQVGVRRVNFYNHRRQQTLGFHRKGEPVKLPAWLACTVVMCHVGLDVIALFFIVWKLRFYINVPKIISVSKNMWNLHIFGNCYHFNTIYDTGSEYNIFDNS